jgi:acetyl esterase/lipase
VVDYRLAPEDPFPAAVHDIYAAYLYLTQPNHPAITFFSNGSSTNNPHYHVSTPILPKDIVLAGDSAGAGVAIAFQLYMRDYVQPSVEPKFEMPPVTVLISVNVSFR